METVEKTKKQLSAREKRFLKFASAEYKGQIYMTPQVGPVPGSLLKQSGRKC
jgi:hypothetical protein